MIIFNSVTMIDSSSLIHLVVLLFIVTGIHAESAVPTGEDVCTFEEEQEVSQLERYDKTVPYRTTVWCADISRGFKCPVTRYGTKLSYRNVTVKKMVLVKRCCKGFRQTDDNTCIPKCDKPCLHGECVGANECQCEPGYGGETCAKSCPKGLWGANCDKTCDCENDALCDPESGICQCTTGFLGDRCEQTCDTGKWGPRCEYECQCQHGGSCDPASGACKCPAGYKGRLCLQKCETGLHGVDCKAECACKNGATCEPETGACFCPAGFAGLLCERTCPRLHFGANCSEKCDCLNENDCDSTTGRCECVGFTGDQCDVPCAMGTYGAFCAFHCLCGSQAWCNPINGSCQCVGDQCQTSDALELQSARPTSTTIALVIILLAVVSVILIGLVLYYRRKYMKERDPDLPTVTFHPSNDGKGCMMSPIECESNEFNNPLYGKRPSSYIVDQPTRVSLPPIKRTNDNITLTDEEKRIERIKLGVDLDDDKAEYASADEFAPSTSHSPLNHDGFSPTPSNRYEVPYRQKASPNSSIVRQNNENEMKSRRPF